jgi:hypothetical protein
VQIKNIRSKGDKTCEYLKVDNDGLITGWLVSHPLNFEAFNDNFSSLLIFSFFLFFEESKRSQP